jgi:ATP-dependent Lon protease
MVKTRSSCDKLIKIEDDKDNNLNIDENKSKKRKRTQKTSYKEIVEDDEVEDDEVEDDEENDDEENDENDEVEDDDDEENDDEENDENDEVEDDDDEDENEEENDDEENDDEENDDEVDEVDDDDVDNNKIGKSDNKNIVIKSIMSEVIKKTFKKQKYDNGWKKDLSKNEIETLDIQYKKICDVINKVPTIKDILKTNMPFKTKCNIMEKYIILENTEEDTFEYIMLKNNINEEINKYAKSNLSFEKYSDIEEEINKAEFNDMPLKYRILSSEMPFHNKVVVYNKFKHLENLTDSNSEHSKLMNWIETALKIPTIINNLPITITDGNSKISEFLFNTKTSLDKKIYGLNNVKEQILFIINNMITNPNARGLGMALVGPQGVGKTEIVQVLAEAVKLPFTQISLGGSNDSSFLSGHNYTYEGSCPGAIVTSLIKMKQLNGILFFDELDKISDTKNGNEVSNILLHITDSTQNEHFKDKYLGNEMSINLSNLWFVYSMNYINNLDRTLRDRIPIIKVDGYSKSEKKEIAKLYLIPKELKNLGISNSDILFSNEALTYIIDKTDELYISETKDKEGKSGVRQLKFMIANIIMKLNMIKNCVLEDGTFGNLKLSYAINDFKLPFIVEKCHIDKLDVLPKCDKNNNLSMYI